MNRRPGEGGGAFNSGPEILRPIPRRPFNLNSFSSPTPPEEDEDRASSPRPSITANDLRFLDPHNRSSSSQSRNHDRDNDTPLSHTTSFLNLTQPTLFGIYTPSTTDPFSREPDQEDESYFRDPTSLSTDDDDAAPRFPGLDDETYELMRERSAGSSYARRGSTFTDTTEIATPAPKWRKREVALALALRAGLLFVLGVGYGVLVTRLPRDSRQRQLDGLVAEWGYLVFWGAAGVVLGGLLPWFDKIWEEAVGMRKQRRTAGKELEVTSPGGSVVEGAAAAPEADWALVIRGIGAFVGIVFAIRKLPWASTMQVSLTLALTNPFLWYLIDRSKPGFLLSTAVGLAGSAMLMGLNPDMMPLPAELASSSLFQSGNVSSGTQRHEGIALGGLASHETIETSIWMLSVLFCSCVCFGNIGRRLALNSSAAGRGRWGGVR